MIPGFEHVAGPLALALALALAGGGCSVADVYDIYDGVYEYVTETFDDSESASVSASGRYGSSSSSYVVMGERYHIMDSAEGYVERGMASWYGSKFHGRKTSSGEVFDMRQVSAAHKTLPLPTWVRVTHLETGRTINVRVNDRGPFVEGRIIDLSYQAALALGITGEGVAPVEVRAIPTPASAPEIIEHRFLQLGAFADRGNAKDFVQKLRRQGLVRLSVRTRKRYRTLHRVLQGPFRNHAEYNRAISELESLGITDYTPVNIPYLKPIKK